MFRYINIIIYEVPTPMHEGQAGAKLYLYRGYHKHSSSVQLYSTLVFTSTQLKTL